MDEFDQKQATTASFGDVADAYLDSDVHQSGADLELLVSWCDGANRALDIACGAGHTAEALTESAETVLAADATPAMVETATEAFSLPGIVADAERLPFADGSFDAVTCRIAAHHFPNPQAFVNEVARILAPGGVFAFEDNITPEDDELADFYNRFERLRDPTHGEAYSVAQWQDWFRNAGFTIDESVTMRKELEYESWVERTNSDEKSRKKLADLVRKPEAEAVYDVSAEGGTVRGFSNEKVLIQAKK
ncbi:Ubiquinone/menaquinone biosynthesis C-methylase UbiE [Haladaptatus litoreus]|uniref:Ubiquinone/menaquinone biosynthesis C-methylase UbiE n=1 Tax=Haladaptatus litoreus TaxID=553468 RepID=A0A1N6V6P2_9EURY|nr:class I SAM-dependent methyltransferase [Haladaptatus litoreus]SIQ73541.1 Ubiquinone/menaquinone biosynthesis C-methylase UbiE [Haladaptatus litoreus]